MKIKLFHHMADVPRWNYVWAQQAALMIDSGLIDAANEIHFCTNGNYDSFEPARTALACFPNVYFHHLEDRVDLYEWPTINYLKQNIDNDPDESYVAYVHLKGLRLEDTNHSISWRDHLNYWTITRWQDCCNALARGDDTIGLQGKTPTGPSNAKVYSGNFWWARASYIKQLGTIKDPRLIQPGEASPYHGNVYDTTNFRMDQECWLSSGKGRWAEMNTKDAENTALTIKVGKRKTRNT